MTALVMLDDDARVSIREMREGDASFVLSSWKQSYVFTVAHTDRGRSGLFNEMNDRCEWLMAHSAVRIACDPENEDHIFGFACIDIPRQLLHYVAVKQKFQRRGIARALLAGLNQPIACTHWTFDCEPYGRAAKAFYEPSRLREVMNAKYRSSSAVEGNTNERRRGAVG